MALLKYWRLASLCLALAGSIWLGWHLRGLAAERDQARQAEAQAKAGLAMQHRQDAITARIDASATATAAKTQIIYRTINHEVVKYIASNPADCTLPADWVRLHNAAALGQLPDFASTTDASTRKIVPIGVQNHDQ